MKTLLVIEDDRRTRENLCDILELEGYRVRHAADGQTGLACIKEELPDLVLCDVTMPKLDGYGVLAALRAEPRTASLPFVFLTAKGDRPDVRAGMNLGADDYLTKPASAAEILAAVESRLIRHQTMRSKTAPDFGTSVPLEALGLTPREAEVLLWVAQGKTNADVGVILGMSEKTVKIHLGHIFAKLAVETRTAAALLAIEVLGRT